MSDYLDTGNTRLLEDSVVEARGLAAALASHASALRNSPTSFDALDEVLRSAHSLRTEAAAAGMQSLSSLAKLIRDTAEALRAGLHASPEGSSMLIDEAAQVAVRLAGGEEADAAAVSALLAEARDRAGRVEVPRAPTVQLRVSSDRVDAALSAVADVERAAAGLEEGGQDPQSLLIEVREAVGQYRSTMTAVAREIPGVLESVRAGAACTDASREIFQRFAPVEALLAQAEEKLSGAARGVSEAAASCTRAVRDLREAVVRIRQVPLAAVFHALGRTPGFRAGLDMQDGGVEVDASIVADIRGILAALVRCRLPPGRRKRETPAVSIAASAREGMVTITVGGGLIARPPQAKAARLEAETAVAHLGGSLAGGKTIEVRFPRIPGVSTCLLLRVGTEWCAVPGDSVVECVSVAASATLIRRDGKDIPLVALETLLSPSAPRARARRADRAAVIVRSGRRLAGLAGDAHAGMQNIAILGALETPRPLVASAGLRADGTAVHVLDVPHLVSRAHAGKDR